MQTQHHVFLGERHADSERRTWIVIVFCGAMMVGEIAGGLVFGSIALVADGLHMSTHAGALLLAALAYRYARRHVGDPRFSFGTGKFGDLAGFTSAVVLAMIALLIAYEAIVRLFHPVPIHFNEAIPIACLGLAVNIISAWLLSGGHGHDHGHAHGHAHGHDHDHDHDHDQDHDHGHHHAHDESHAIETPDGQVTLAIVEDGVPPRFQVHGARAASISTRRPDGTAQVFDMLDRGTYLESADIIPEPHEFTAILAIGGHSYSVAFAEPQPEPGDGRAHRDNNMRAAVVHVMADAAVSVLVIGGLLLARTFGWFWMDPLAGLVGATVIASWAWGLVRDTGAILLDMCPDDAMAEQMRAALETDGDRLADFHLWRLGPGHLGAIASVTPSEARDPTVYRERLARFRRLSHVTVEVRDPVTL